MNETGQEPRGIFLSRSGDMPAGSDSLFVPREHGTATQRRQWSRRTWVFVVAGTVVAAAGVVATLRAASDSGTPSPLAAVTAALAHTSAESYRFSLVSTVWLAGREVDKVEVSGAFDPAHGLGTELLTTSRPAEAKIRFIGKYVYTQVSESRAGMLGKPWDKAPAPFSGAGGARGDTYGFVSDQPVSPAELSGLLQYAQSVRDAGPVSGPGWTGTGYAFTAPLGNGQGSVSGTVAVDLQGRVRRMVTIAIQGRIVTTRDFMIGDFGERVTVTAPPATQVKYTSSPYWGFYF